MIREVIEKNRSFDTSFEIKSIEEMNIKIVIEYLRSTVML